MEIDKYLYACAAYPCNAERAEGSVFCAKDKAEHAKSKYPALLREAMALAKKDKK